MRTFVLIRDTDETGVSGTGKVAEGAEFSDGTIALRWLPVPRELMGTGIYYNVCSTSLWANVMEMLAIHGHDGMTRIEYTSGGLA